MTTAVVPYSKNILLTMGKTTMVSYWMYEWINQWKWYAHIKRGSFYAMRKLNGRPVSLHRFILKIGDFKTNKVLVDHENHNTLDNTERNIRICTYTENNRNALKKKNSASKYKGVRLWTIKSKSNGKEYVNTYWRSAIKFNKKDIHIKCFPRTPEGEILAARAYDKKAIELFNKFAVLNFPD